MKNSWEDYFNHIILFRGYQYYQQDLIQNVVVESPYVYADAIGSKVYKVLVNKDNMDCQCTCPHFQSGNFCKHIAGLCYYIEHETELEFGCKPIIEETEKDTEIFEDIAIEDLLNLLKRELPQYPKLYDKVKALVIEEDEPQDITLESAIENFEFKIDLFINEDNMISWYDCDDFTNEYRNLLNYYLNQLDQDLDFKRKLLRASLLLLFNVESENGYGNITDFIEVQYKILINQSDLSFKEKIFKDLIAIAQTKHIDCYRQDITQIIYSNFDESIFKNKKLVYLKTQDDTFHLLKYMKTLIFYDEPKIKIDAYYQKHQEVQEISVAYIKYLIDKKYIDEALNLLYEKVNTYEKLYGQNEYAYLIKEAYKNNGQIDKYKEALVDLLLQYNACNVDNYLELKDLHSKDDWDESKHHLFNQLNKIKGADKIYFYEDEKLYLLKHLKMIQSLDLLRTYEQYLIDDYSEELFNLNIDIIREKAEKSKNRKEYRELAYMLAHLFHYKNKDEVVANHIKSLQQNYKNRPALIDELNRIKKI